MSARSQAHAPLFGANDLKVFLSYVEQDAPVADSLARALAPLGIQVWREHVETFPGDNRDALRGAAMEDANAMVSILSPDYVESSRATYDLQFAIARLAFRGRVVSVVAATDRMPEDLFGLFRHFPVITVQQFTPNDPGVKDLAEVLRGAEGNPTEQPRHDAG